MYEQNQSNCVVKQGYLAADSLTAMDLLRIFDQLLQTIRILSTGRLTNPIISLQDLSKVIQLE